MIRFSPNFHHIFLELPARERFAAAAKCGCKTVEWHFPYEVSKEELKLLLEDNDLEFTYGVVPADWAAGVWGLAGQPGLDDRFKAAAETALEYIAYTDWFACNVGAGPVPPGIDRQACVDTYIANIDHLARQAGDLRCKFVLEPVCAARVEDWTFQTMAQAAEIVRAVGRDNVRLNYDTFHMRLQEQGTLSAIMDEYWDLIAYVQIGNAPDRHEPGVGEIDLLYLVERAVAKGYTGAFGLELDPSMDSWSSLVWMNDYGYTVDPDNR